MLYERNSTVTGASDAGEESWHTAANVVISDVTERHRVEIWDSKMCMELCDPVSVCHPYVIVDFAPTL